MLPARNLLAEETSPYLQQHRDNPVHWRAWSPEALAEAQALDRPILLSIGYAACHWCHVMAHESFENDAVAAVMNRLFINIKVDREERPEIDQIYMAALAATGEQGGWPLTMFLTPDGSPFWGGTYFPPEPRFGRPGFVQVLQAIDAAWREKRHELTKSAGNLKAHVQASLAPPPGEPPEPDAMLRDLAARVHGMIDPALGGLRGAPKFPNAPFMKILWLDGIQHGDRTRIEAVADSLRHMLSGGIYDHVGGGLARYAVDDRWVVPHFEKMLYDNAQLLQLLCWVYARTHDQLFRIRIEETVDWLLREMRVDGGGFASSLDADTDGEEGKTYVWSRQELGEVLGSEAGAFLDVFTLEKPADWHRDPILHRLNHPAATDPASETRMRTLLDRLLVARQARPQPGRDDKLLVDWNGMTITALATAGRLLDRPDWTQAARTAFRFVCESMENGRLPHSIRGDKQLFPALSSDYAAMISAATALYGATSDDALLQQARKWAGQLQRWHQDKAGSGFYMSASDSGDVPMRIRGDVDEAIPSATSQVIEALAALATLTGDEEMTGLLHETARTALGRAARQPYGQAGTVHAASVAVSARKLVMVEPAGSVVFIPVANRNPDPRRFDSVVSTGGEKVTLPGDVVVDTTRPAAYLCIGQTCLPPFTEPSALEEALRE
ncbi:thioredoxin domain-containing protein [Nitratireductor pacificus]|uniref:Spermatogenesis-associated protein 20-like TRX domain-containing protein n=1 Tax=Nitratireductor pacificus pht-3B TaxID=391937 RepID=K2MP22_9HYPH|nr:thioredoxin domain-containing protein [Nitratireductor pacificus]EKF19027.1 hypothetical protein NA2_09603 [Nitratireductor pacificus pht-3B]